LNYLHQCFDLGTYLELNKTAGGQRWKCGCCELFLSYQDLEVCALTEQGLKRFGDKMTSGQHMVEFREDKSMELMKPPRSRQERTRAKKAVSNNNSSTNNQASSGVIEILEILSDSD